VPRCPWRRVLRRGRELRCAARGGACRQLGHSHHCGRVCSLQDVGRVSVWAQACSRRARRASARRTGTIKAGWPLNLPYYVADADEKVNREEREEEDLLPIETDDEVLKAELRVGPLDTADVRAVVTYEAGTSSGQRAGHCQRRSFVESTEALCQRWSRSGDGWGWCACYVFVEVEEGCVWSSRLCASASYCILFPYNTTIDGSCMLCYHE
jgi:hypothetical protein